MSERTYEDLKRLLAEAGVEYRELRHDPGASADDYNRAVGCRYSQQAKCLFLKFERDGLVSYAVYTMPASQRADLGAAAATLGARKVRLADRQELEDVTGCRFGELPPTGRLFDVPLLMDRGLLDEERIYLNAGLVDVSFVLDPRDLVAAERPLMIGEAT